MNIIDNIQPQPQPQTVEDKAQATLSHIGRGYRTIKNAHQRGMAMVWNDDTFTAQQIFDAMGADAEDAVVASATLAAAVAAINPADVIQVPAGKEIVFNGDGTVTVQDV